MSKYIVNELLERLWNDYGDEEDISGEEFVDESDEDYLVETESSGPHRDHEKKTCSERELRVHSIYIQFTFGISNDWYITRGFNKNQQPAKFAIDLKGIDLHSPPTFSEINNIRIENELPLAAYFAVFAVCLKTY